MEITKDNFAELFPTVKDAINECDYLAIDTELTGLLTEATDHAFDTMHERYVKYRKNCSKFLIIQYGLSTFKYHPAQNKYTHRDFNFYVFPRPHCKQAPDHTFMCQASSIHFLTSHGFDFNKVIYEGISYLTPAQEEAIKSFLTTKHQNEQDALQAKSSSKSNGQKEMDVPHEHKEYLANVLECVESFVSDDSRTAMQLPPCNSFLRRLIYENVQRKYLTGIEMSSEINAENQRFISIVKSTEQEKFNRLHLKQETDLVDLDAAVGFRKVLDAISQSRKLVIGHNMFLDIMHTVKQFYFPLPEHLKEYKQMVRELFPRIIDTKHLASSEKLRPFFECTQLGKIAEQLQGKAFNVPKIEIEDGFNGYELNSDKAHEAGFDAFLTGFCYTGLTKKLGSLQNPPIEHLDISSKILSPLVNRIFIMRHYDIYAMNLSGLDPEPNRENVFYVSFPQQWKMVDLTELFLPYGNIYVNWIDDVSALVALKNKDHIINVKSNLLKKMSKLYCVRTYAEFQNQMNQSDLEKTDLKRSVSTPSRKSSVKRRASGCAEEMDLIPEADENEAEGADDSVSTSHDTNRPSVKSKASSSGTPSSKKQKCVHEDNELGEVSSTAPLFEEENNW